MLTLEGWIHGLFNTFSLFFGSALGLSLLYRSKKKELKILMHAGLLIFLAAIVFTLPVIDFFTILVTGNNFYDIYIAAIITVFLGSIALIAMWHVGTELIFPNKKKLIMYVYIVVVIMFLLVLIFDFDNTGVFIYPPNPGSDLLLFTFKLETFAFFTVMFSYLSIVIFLGFGFLYKGIRSAGLLRKKFLFLSFGFTLFSIGWVLFFIFTNYPFPYYATIPKTMFVFHFIFWYYGFKEETPKVKKKHVVIDMKQAEYQSKFVKILAEGKPSDISEEEILYSREQQICIVCKGEELGFTYICPECKTLYCENCARSISNLENACWVCNAPIDKSKPVKIEEREKEDIIVKDSKKTPKKPKPVKK